MKRKMTDMVIDQLSKMSPEYEIDKDQLETGIEQLISRHCKLKRY